MTGDCLSPVELLLRNTLGWVGYIAIFITHSVGVRKSKLVPLEISVLGETSLFLVCRWRLLDVSSNNRKKSPVLSLYIKGTILHVVVNI